MIENKNLIIIFVALSTMLRSIAMYEAVSFLTSVDLNSTLRVYYITPTSDKMSASHEESRYNSRPHLRPNCYEIVMEMLCESPINLFYFSLCSDNPS